MVVMLILKRQNSYSIKYMSIHHIYIVIFDDIIMISFI
nr:MAG TPA: hypothetical protein [Caudoviricetes sp.]